MPAQKRSRPPAAKPTEPGEGEGQGSSTSSPESSASTASPLGLVGAPFTRPDDDNGTPKPLLARDLEEPEYEPPAPVPIEWTPERAALIVRGFGLVLHSLDPVASTPHAPDLWKMTEDDAEAIAEPLSRIANRYATLRGVAGYSDELGVGLAVWPYMQRNLAERGRAKTLTRAAEQASPHASRYDAAPAAVAPVAETYTVVPTHVEDVDVDDDVAAFVPPKPDAGDVFDTGLWEPAPTHLPPHETSRGD